MINEQLGDYLITKSLGKGGFGSVWEATAEDGNTVALKVLNPQVLENAKVVRKFFHEAMILAKLDHPNICRLMEFFPDGENYCIVMEYVKGVELKKLIAQRQGPLPFDPAYNIAKHCLDAFQYAHKNGILHRDIKPANIMINEDHVPKIMDFGIAKMGTTASHDTAASMLSIHYVPPERFDRSTEIDVRSDIYSLALVFYEMFAGRRPFTATETSQIMFSHMNEIPDPPNKFAEHLPAEVSQAISQALEKDPDDRFNDFAEFSRAMEIDQQTHDDVTMIFDETLLDPVLDIAAAKEIEVVDDVAAVKKKSPMGLIAAVLAVLVIVGAAAGYFLTKSKGPAGPPPPPPEEIEIGVKNSKGFYEIIYPGDESVMVLIKNGEFTMGSDNYSAEKPPQKIYMDKYYIDKYLVSNQQYQKFVESTQYVTDAEKEGSGLVRIGRRWKKIPEASWKKPDGLTEIEGKDDHPVSQVSYNDASSYCQWTGKDLPTEAQWEKAARGPDGNEYPWGASEPDDTTANYDNIIGATTPVTAYDKGQSHYGPQDMGGNVYQWIKDWYATGERAAKNPVGPETGKEHVIKGGSFMEGSESLRSANRDRYPANYSSFLFGFRCAAKYPLPDDKLEVMEKLSNEKLAQ
ncbi:MAG: SUMF1/EgtB/PvdO family nonheme iron enzyme [Deltaproteobacteria bacterium]|nr:SUMF1/EgtB/PvdO family nonheme iron enzyme [Deltaproteobacteria bacterium]